MREPDVEAAFEEALSRFDGDNFDRLTVSNPPLQSHERVARSAPSRLRG